MVPIRATATVAIARNQGSQQTQHEATIPVLFATATMPAVVAVAMAVSIAVQLGS